MNIYLLKKRKNKSLFLKFLTFFLILNLSLCGISVFPDHYILEDSPFSDYSSSSDVREVQVYKLGFFSSSTAGIKSYKYGFEYSPDTSCSGTKINQETVFIINYDKTSTRNNNFSEETELLKNICWGNSLTLKNFIPTLHNTGYVLKYKQTIFSTAQQNVVFYVKVGTNPEEKICSYPLNANSPEWFKMTIKSLLSETNKITMNFLCDKVSQSLTITLNTSDQFDFIIKSSNTGAEIYLSFYQVILQDTTNSYLTTDYETDNIVRTNNGMEKCSTDWASNCLMGYYCNSEKKCIKCNSNCNSCTDATGCKKCWVLTDLFSNTDDCTTNYVDMRNYDDIIQTIPTSVDQEFHERTTMGLWIFISNLNLARNSKSNIYHIVLTNRYVISIIPNELSVGLYCHAYEDLYRGITTETTLQNNYIDRTSDYVLEQIIPTDEQLKYITKKDLSGQWFHVSCGLSFDHKKYFLNSVMNGEIATIERTLRHENLYYDSSKDEYVENDIYFRHIVNGEGLTIEFRNFAGSDANIYLRYYTLFQEYIPSNYLYMYYDYFSDSDVFTKNFLLYAIPFNSLKTNTIKGKNCKNQEVEITLKVPSNVKINFTPALNFKTLYLLPPNNIYNYINLNKNEASIFTISGFQLINWDDNKPLLCEGYLKTQDGTCVNGNVDNCQITNNLQAILYPGPSTDTGYCDFECSGAMKCIAGENFGTATLSDLGFCRTNNQNIYNLFYSCENKETNYYFQYSSFYNTKGLELGFNGKQSFIIEFWYYPDFFLSDPNREGKYYYPDRYKNYVFYSNVVTAYYLYSEEKTLRVEDAYSTHIVTNYHPYEWNKFVFHSIFYKEDNKYLKYFYINNLIYDPIEFKHVYKDEHGKLLTIKFFITDRDTDPLSKERGFATGYYKGLRIWDGDIASVPLSVQYDNFFTNDVNRVSSILRYYPLTNQYISNDKIWEIIDVSSIEIEDVGTRRLRKYNFSSKFDFIRSQYPSLGYYLQSDASAPKASQCGTGCLRCWNAGSNCYECMQGYVLTLNRACVKGQYYFRSPCINKNKDCDATLKLKQEIYSQSPITCNFWIKVIGFGAASPVPIIQYSKRDVLYFASQDSGIKKFGLTLVDTVNSKSVANDPNFREKIGYWSFISLAYYAKKSDVSNGDYFPMMIHFEINEESFKIDSTTEKVEFNEFKIYTELFGLVYNVRFYSEYIIGAYGFATNEGDFTPPFTRPNTLATFLSPGDSASSCFSGGFIKDIQSNYICSPDYDVLFESFAQFTYQYITYSGGYTSTKLCDFKSNSEDSVALCLNACKTGEAKYSCSCLNKNYNSQMLIKANTDEIDFCRTLSFINFSKAKKIVISNLQTAKETKKFTLQFWIYFYNYDQNQNNHNFEGSTFYWVGHNKIIVYRDNNSYKTKCITWYDDSGVQELVSDTYDITPTEWNFISCSISYPDAVMYLNINTDADGPDLKSKTINPSNPTPFLTSQTVTTMEITDDTALEEWGYLFYRQIHLWKDCYFNAEFLSRVNILTPSKFPYLLHTWDTKFKGYKDLQFPNNFVITDIAHIANDFNVTYQGTLGFNVIHESDIKDLTLCSEDGEYYDRVLKKNLQFSDLGQLEDFSFDDVPYSYTGSYSMGFWIFFEDAATMTSGIHFRWERHLQVTVIKMSQLDGYCFPQGYYADDYSNSDISVKANALLNKVDTHLVPTGSESGVWIWVLCSVSNYAKTFFIKGQGDVVEKEMVAETLYSDSVRTVLNKYPYHYFMSEVEDRKPQTSKLYLENLKSDKRIYIRQLFLFKDYIPYWYADAFKYTDLSELPATQLIQSLVLIANFAHFDLTKMTLNYYTVTQTGYGTGSTFTKEKKTVKLTLKSASKTFELSANFAFIPIYPPKSYDKCKPDGTTSTTEINKIYYCNETLVHIVCRYENLYITRNAQGQPVCSDTCESGYIRVPGSPSGSGICGIKHPADTGPITMMSDYLGHYGCTGSDYQVGYQCFPATDNEDSAFFFSRCYNQPNFYGEISLDTKNKFANGYFYEFWFKLDKVQILNHCNTDATEEYLLFSTPHSIYLDLNENQYYYKIIDTIYSSKIDGISDYEWNKIVIKTTLGSTLGQNVYVYINFDIDNIKATITSIPSSVKMQLQYISFCSKESNGDCTAAGTASVTWGSAYYRNIRIWELFSSSIYSIQDFNIGIFEEKPLSLKLFYPLILSEINKNNLTQIMGNEEDTITVSHEESDDFNSNDKYGFYNWATHFDWGVEVDAKGNNKNKFISSMDQEVITSQDCGSNCERCYSSANTNCYKCKVGYVLKGMSCVLANGYYLKIPGTLSTTAVEFNIGSTSRYKGVTINFYMKFEGVVQNPKSSLVTIMNFNTGVLRYNTATANLELNVGSESDPAFTLSSYYNYIGQWVPYSIAVYVSEKEELYPDMLTLAVNKEDVPFYEGYKVKDLKRVNLLNLGDEVIALFADLRIYGTFIQGVFGHAISCEKNNGLILQYDLKGSNAGDCYTNAINVGEPDCKEDYIDYIEKNCGTDINSYFDLSLINLEEPCSACSSYCKTKCFNAAITQCTCNMTDALYWLRRNYRSLQTYCEYLPSIDYSILNDFTIKVPTSQSRESTLEFWIFIYSYNTDTNQFHEVDIEWNLHNRVIIKNQQGPITATCYAQYDENYPNDYTEHKDLSIDDYSWVMIRCGSDLIHRKYFLNDQEAKLVTTSEVDRSSLVTNFNFKNHASEPSSYGYLFIREIKLFQQYNFKYIVSQFIDLKNLVGSYEQTSTISTGVFPGLLAYIKSEFDPADFEQVKTKNETKIINECGSDELAAPYPKTNIVKRRSDFLGYNIVDPDNTGLYDDLTLCSEGYVYNSGTESCIELALSHCEYPGDTTDNCITCAQENKYIYPPDGSCVNDCGVQYYKNDYMNQCRPCHETCYTCWDYMNNTCLSCTGNYYYVEYLHICVYVCEDYGLIASSLEPNLCVEFDVNMTLVNYQEYVPIDINTFYFLVAQIHYLNAESFTTQWGFDPELTRELNNDPTMVFKSDTPFEKVSSYQKNSRLLNVTVDNTFFELAKNYSIYCNITSRFVSSTGGSEVKLTTRTIRFVLTMNSYPVNGSLEITPTVGLHKTTVFILRCQNWTDDTIKSESELTYSFYAIEDGTTDKIDLKDWGSENEITYKFALQKDALKINNVTVYCKVRDNYLAETEISKSISLVTNLTTNLYSLENALKEYYLPDKQFTTLELLHISELLQSLGYDIYKVLLPTFYQTQYYPSSDKTMVAKTDPSCIGNMCNLRGNCRLVDEFLVCFCNDGYVGRNCHIPKNDADSLLNAYKELYYKLIGTMQGTLSYNEFKVIHNIFDGAKYFAEDPTFFSVELETFLNMAMNVYGNSIDENTYEYFDLLDDYYYYELERLNKKRIQKMVDTGLSFRNLSIDVADQQEFKEAFSYIHTKLNTIINYVASLHINTQISYTYETTNLYIVIKSVNPTFDETSFFSKRKENYHSFPRFMSCLNYIENTKLNNPYFQTFMIYIEYLNFPFGYNNTIYDINTSPLIELRFLDATNGKTFDLSDCVGPAYINIDMPLTNYRWLDQVNLQRDLYDPKNYKTPDDPIFSDPIYINKSGYVSNDTVEQRIAKYHRVYNFSSRYYDADKDAFLDDGVINTNFTSDTNFIEFNTSHLTRFSTFFVLNNATFKVSGRFFYVVRPELMKWKGNYDKNFGLIVFIILVGVYVLFSFILGCYDSIYFVQETLLESLKKEIVKVFLPYRSKKDKDKEAKNIIPIGLSPDLIKDTKAFGDKTKKKGIRNQRYAEKDEDPNIIDDFEAQDKLFIKDNKFHASSGDRLTEEKANKFIGRSNKREITQMTTAENIMTTGNKPDLNLSKEISDFYKSNIAKKELKDLNPNKLPEIFENAEVEKNRRLNAYANLGLTFCEFLGKNFLNRNIFISPFFNISMFGPRWKKLIVFTTEIATEILLIVVFLTDDETAIDTNITSLIKYSIFSVLITNVFMHVLTILFQVSARQRRRLLKLVLTGGQLIVLKEYEDIQCLNAIKTFVGMLISYSLWAFSFYMSFTFYSVWKIQNKAFIYTCLMAIVEDFILLEFLYEMFLAVIYLQRKNSACLRRVGEFLNRVRNHRTMS